ELFKDAAELFGVVRVVEAGPAEVGLAAWDADRGAGLDADDRGQDFLDDVAVGRQLLGDGMAGRGLALSVQHGAQEVAAGGGAGDQADKSRGPAFFHRNTTSCTSRDTPGAGPKRPGPEGGEGR